MAGADRPVGIGMIGAGMVGQLAHLANFKAIPACRVVALAELRPELGHAAATKFDVPSVYASHRELLADPAVDAVVVVTRRPATGPIVLDALEAGRHVLSEKPMAHSVEQAERLVAAAQRHDRRYAVGYMKRHDAGARHAKALLDRLRASGELGRIVMVRGYCLGGDFVPRDRAFVMTEEPRPEGLVLWPTAPAWLPPEHATDYAWFLNVFIHDLNILRYLVGATPTVSAVDLRRPNGRLAMLDFGAFPGILEMAEIPSRDWQEGVEIRFERGTLTVAFNAPLASDRPARVVLTRVDAAEPEVFVPPPSWSFRRQAEAFVADVASGAEPLAGGRDALEDLRLAEAIWRCALARP
jgi:predicted dehydrogenase